MRAHPALTAAACALSALLLAAAGAPGASARLCLEVFESCSAGSTDWSTCTSLAIVRVTETNREARPFTCLSQVTEILSEVSVVGAGIESFEGLDGVTALTGDVSLRHLDHLQDLSLFASLPEVGGVFLKDLAVTNLAGMGALRRVRDGSLVVTGMPNLESMAGIESLEIIDGFLSVTFNGALRSLDGLQGLARVRESVNVYFNSELRDIDALASLRLVEGSEVAVWYNAKLESIRLCGIETDGVFARLTNNRMVDCESLAAMAAGQFVTSDIAGCQEDGGAAWSCAAVSASCPPLSGYPETPAGVIATQPCGDGFMGLKTRPCSADGVWLDQSTAGCSRAQCSALSGYPATDAGATATQPCGDGFVGLKTRECSADAQWLDQSTAGCSRAQCSALSGYPATNAGETATQPCGAGFTGMKTRECSADAQWLDQSTAGCRRAQCAALSGYPATNAGQTATQPCGPGYVGLKTRECSADAQWLDQSTAACRRADCPALSGYPQTAAGATASQPCGAGFTGDKTRRCSFLSVWEDESTEACERV